MISGPFIHIILESHGVGVDEEDSQGHPGLISPVAPPVISPGCEAQGTDYIVQICEEADVDLTEGNQCDPVQGSQPAAAP